MTFRPPAALALLLAGCATAAPRFSQDIAASFAHQDMRRLETEHLQLYYPAAHREATLRLAQRMEQCVAKLRAKEPERPGRERDRFLVFLTDDNFNNSYVQPPDEGNPQQMVLAVHMTLEAFDFYDIGTDPSGDVSCHESTHYVTFEQIEGFWRGVNFFFGDLLSPQSFLDSWLHEGMATYYEARLGKPVGRPMSPFWSGAFAAGLASQESLDAGFLNQDKRALYPYGAQYLSGLQFVTWLAQRYGEEKLWELIDKQAGSIFSPLWVTLRFKAVYGLSIGALFDEFVADRKAHEIKRERPPGQRALASAVGTFARIAAAPDGAIAAITESMDDPTRLVIRERDGRVRVSRRLTSVLPFRKHVEASPVLVSGMDFSSDGRWLYLVSVDVDSDGSDTGRLWKVDARSGALEQIWNDVPGPGGCLTADGAGYVSVENHGDVASLVRLSLADGAREVVHTFPPATTVTAPACAPDGRIAFGERGDRGMDLYLRETDGRIVRLTLDGRFNTQPRWLDASHLLFVREQDGRSQAHVMDLATRAIWPTTDAPFGVLDPRPLGNGELAFLNREGWGFSLDAAPLALSPPAGQPFSSEGPGLLSNAGPALEAEAEHPLEPAPPLVVKQDEAYSGFDHLFVPTLHAPFIGAVPIVDTTTNKITGLRFVGALSLMGSDRLDLHSWAINLAYDSSDKLPSVSVGYGNYQLAPWFIDLTGALVNVGPAYDRYAELGFSRTFWTTPVRFYLVGIDHHTEGATSDTVSAPCPSPWKPTPETPSCGYRLVGPGVQASFLGTETTPYGGIRRGLGLAFAGSYYPKLADSDFNLGDVSGQADLWLPLPISKRHIFHLSARGRALLSSQTEELLEVGGVVTGQSFGEISSLRNPKSGAVDYQLLSSPTLLFGEYLRGYQDQETAASAFTVVSASYTYPFIIDYGWASLLYLLPPLFLRQIDLELFGEMAWLWPSPVTLRRSAGGALYLRTSLGGLPLSFYAQVAERFDASDRVLATFGVSFE